jgi:hypothetical protein
MRLMMSQSGPPRLAPYLLRFCEKHNLASKLFLFNKETQVETFFESVFGKSKCDCRCLHF